MSFPRSPEQLTSEWLGSVLGTRVRSFDISPLGEGIGILGLVTRIRLDADDCAPTLIAKFPSPSSDNRGVADTYNLYAREYAFYTELAENLSIRTPLCHHAELDRSSNDFILLLEDLVDYRLGDQVQGCSKGEARQVIEWLAGLHASTWQKEAYSHIEKHDSQMQIDGMVGGFSAFWPVMREQFPHLVSKETFAAFEGLPEKLASLIHGFCEAPLCIAHGDTRLDNIFFAEKEIVLVDFQAVCRSAPEHDLSYFVTQSLADDVRRAEDWVAVYHELLTGQGVRYSLADCRERYRRCALYFLCYAVIIAGQLDLSNERGRQLGNTVLGNSIRSMHELKTADLLETL